MSQWCQWLYDYPCVIHKNNQHKKDLLTSHNLSIVATCLATSLFYQYTGWWFGRFFIFHNIWDVILPIDELIFFRGVAQPPTSIHLSCLPCQEGGQLEQFKLMQDRSKGSKVWRITKSSLLPRYNMSIVLQSSMPQCQSKTCSHLMSFVFIYI